MPKRGFGDWDDESLPPTWENLPLRAIMEFLNDDPMTLLACMMVDKASRGAAGRQLNHYHQPSPATLMQKVMFEEQFLNKPHLFSSQFKKDDSDNIAGPFRKEEIKKMCERILQNIVILKYEKTYRWEKSAVAIMDDEGQLLAIYKFFSKQFYEEHCHCLSMHDMKYGNIWCPDCNPCSMKITNSGALGRFPRQAENAWKFQRPDLSWECNQGDGCSRYLSVAQPNYELFRLFEGRLSPTEVAAVLMHALSSDSRSIFDYVDAVYNELGENFDYQSIYMETYDDAIIENLLAWRDELKSIEYQRAKQPKKST